MSLALRSDQPMIESLLPFGAVVLATGRGSLLDIPPALITDLLDRHALLVFRGFAELSDTDYIGFSQQFGELLQWEFGAILQLKVQPQPANHIFTTGRVELHWDGAFVDRRPRYNVFQCLEGCTSDTGGNTLFVDTARVLELADETERQAWRAISIEYRTEKKAHYGGNIRSPLICNNPYSGKDVIRYIEAFNEDNEAINPMQVRVDGVSEEESRRFLRAFTKRLYRNDVMYRHVWRTGDFVIADNSRLLHGRSRYTSHDVTRFIKRINIL